MLSGAMADSDNSSPTRQTDSGAPFRLSLIGWTLAYWAIVYLLLTLRSLAVGNPYLAVQAVLRIPMVLIGLASCSAIYFLLKRVDEHPLQLRIAVAAAASAMATFAFSASAYIVYYIIPGIWRVEVGAIASIGYYSFQFIWIFPTWILIYFYLNYRVDAPRPSSKRVFAQEFWVRHLGRQVRVAVADVDWIEAEGDYVRLHIADRSYLIRSTMGNIARRLDPVAFVRIHRRSIVARRTIVSIRRAENGNARVELATGVMLPVGRSYAHSLKANGTG